MVKHALSSGEYNRRRRECELGVEEIARAIPGVRALRDVTLPNLERLRDRLDPVIYRRCRHVITENERTVAAAAALEQNDLTRFGALMRESHRSLRDDYEVSCEELDAMVAIADEQPGVHGSRMTGGGFGGCVIALVSADHAETFAACVAERYFQRTGIRGEFYICSAAEGAGEEPGS
jgi:galactokinase